jgi:hypothetical protein
LGKVRASEAVMFAAAFEVDEELALLEELAAEFPADDPHASPHRLISPTNRYITPVPDRGMIGHAEFEMVVNQARKTFVVESGPDQLAAACILAVVGCFTPHPQIANTLEVLPDGRGVRRTPLREQHEVFQDLNGIHAPVDKFISFSVPGIIHDACRLCVEHRAVLPDEQFLNNFIQRWEPDATLARLLSYLAYTGPDFWGYSPVIPQLSIWGIGRNPSVFASYVRLDDHLLSSLRCYYGFLAGDTGYAKLGSSPEMAYGCPHVPVTNEVQAFFRKWNECLVNLPSSSAPDEWLSYHNAIVAGMHLFGTIAMGGSRNYPAAPPLALLLEKGFVVHREKATDAVYSFCPWLMHMMPQYTEIRSKTMERLASAGFSVPGNSSQAYGMMEMRKNQIVECGVRAASIAAAVEDFIPLAQWAALHPNAFRAFAMTELYRSGRFHTHAIEAFFGRADQALPLLSLGRLEDPAYREDRRHIADYLLQCLEGNQ